MLVDDNGLPVQCSCRLSSTGLSEIRALADARVGTIAGDCVRTGNSTDYSFVLQASFSLETIWMVRDARLIHHDQTTKAQAAPAPTGPSIAPSEGGAMREADFIVEDEQG